MVSRFYELCCCSSVFYVRLLSASCCKHYGKYGKFTSYVCIVWFGLLLVCLLSYNCRSVKLDAGCSLSCNWIWVVFGCFWFVSWFTVASRKLEVVCSLSCNWVWVFLRSWHFLFVLMPYVRFPLVYALKFLVVYLNQSRACNEHLFVGFLLVFMFVFSSLSPHFCLGIFFLLGFSWLVHRVCLHIFDWLYFLCLMSFLLLIFEQSTMAQFGFVCSVMQFSMFLFHSAIF